MLVGGAGVVALPELALDVGGGGVLPGPMYIQQGISSNIES